VRTARNRAVAHTNTWRSHTTETTPVFSQREPELLGQAVVVIGGSSGIGLETARRARAEGAEVILTGRNPERLEQPARELGALSTEAFDATDPDSLVRFFHSLQAPIDHVMVTAGAPPYGHPLEVTPDQARRLLTEHLLLPLEVARAAIGKVRPLGSLGSDSGCCSGSRSARRSTPTPRPTRPRCGRRQEPRVRSSRRSARSATPRAGIFLLGRECCCGRCSR
jgi:NAD(P)-dependent dehydrogenase (short-subunit alcohol dehydrogenase family)